MMRRTPNDTFSELERGPKAGFLVRRGRIVAMASVLAVAPMITGFPQVSGFPQGAAPVRAHPVNSGVRHVGFVKTSVAAMRTAGNATHSAVSTSGAPDPISTARAASVTHVQDVAGAVTVVGVTWPKGTVSARGTFQIRTLTGAAWSRWQSLDRADGGPDSAEAAAATAVATAGTDPYVVTGALKYEVRSLTTEATAPTSATVQAIDPGTSNADSVEPDAGVAPGAAAAATSRPKIYSRADWGANESLRHAAPSYGRVMLGFVHHTDSSNSYSAASVPAMIRGIYAYHVRSQGWNDIGYNFLVDRFGRIWEGRYGGMTRAVVGAQTLNYNAVSMGVSAIGNYEVGAVPQAMTNAFERIFAWKFSLAGIPAIGAVRANGKIFRRVSGHRDGFSTACPGRYLYAKLPQIRAGTAALMGSQPRVVLRPRVVVRPSVKRSVIRRDVDRNGAGDALSYRSSAASSSISGSVSLLVSARRVPVRGGVTIGTGWNQVRSASLSPDLNGDRKADIIAVAGSQLRIYLGNGRGGFKGLLWRGSGWNRLSRVMAAGDRNRDGRNDILAISKAGAMIYFPGVGGGSVRRGRVIGTGWNRFGSVTSAGDLTGDRVPDLLATRRSDGVQLMYAGRSNGALRSGVRWGTGWGSFNTVVGGSDLDGDRQADVYARSGGRMTTYSTDRTGHMRRYIRWGSGWAGLTQLSTGADWNGDGVADLLAVNPRVRAGALIFYAGTGKRDFLTRRAAFPAVRGANLIRLVGDVNGDGYTDAVARIRTNNTFVILRGRPGSRFAAPVRIGTGWNAFTLVEAAGDYDGDGVPDLLARTANGRLLLYSLRRNLTFKAPRTLGSGFQGMQSVLGTGDYNGDGYGDVVALRAWDHALLLFRGTAFHGLHRGTLLARGQNSLAQILGVGDYNGDGKADLLARSGGGSLWLYPGNGGGRVGPQPVRGGEGAGHVLG